MSARLFLALWAAGLPGIAAAVVLVLPQLVAGRRLSIPLPVAELASAAQSAALLALLVAAGVALAPRVNLHAPAFEAWLFHRPMAAALRPQIAPGLVAGVLGGIVLVILTNIAPPMLPTIALELPVSVRLLYGGVTEELLVRWGLMTLLLWVIARPASDDARVPTWAVGVAIVVSAAAFGAGHLPLAASVSGGLTARTALVVIVDNMPFGVIAGWLFWRWGLEAAFIAHATAHLVLIAAR